MVRTIKRIIILTSLFLLIFPLSTSAATLYLDPVSRKLGPDDSIELKIKIGVTGGQECINVASVCLDFSQDVLEVKDFNSGESILSLWVERPERDNLDKINEEGKLNFIGGIPGGYCGKIPGDVGESNILGSVIFSVKKPVIFHRANVSFSSESEVFLNNGLGTAVSVKTQGANFEIDEGKIGVEDGWAEKLAQDIIPPEPFIIEINRNDNIWDGQYFIIFSTNDKQTGIDRYEILEVTSADLLKAAKKRNIIIEWTKKIFEIEEKLPAWQKVSSPYLLKDQGLKSIIAVKAVDKAGNERIVEYQNEALEALMYPARDYSLIVIFVVLIILLFILFIFITLTERGRKNKDSNLKL